MCPGAVGSWPVGSSEFVWGKQQKEMCRTYQLQLSSVTPFTFLLANMKHLQSAGAYKTFTIYIKYNHQTLVYSGARRHPWKDQNQKEGMKSMMQILHVMLWSVRSTLPVRLSWLCCPGGSTGTWTRSWQRSKEQRGENVPASEEKQCSCYTLHTVLL